MVWTVCRAYFILIVPCSLLVGFYFEDLYLCSCRRYSVTIRQTAFSKSFTGGICTHLQKSLDRKTLSGIFGSVTGSFWPLDIVLDVK